VCFFNRARSRALPVPGPKGVAVGEKSERKDPLVLLVKSWGSITSTNTITSKIGKEVLAHKGLRRLSRAMSVAMYDVRASSPGMSTITCHQRAAAFLLAAHLV
jgi:hypothetical protein